ncbi:hypothetical protein G7Y89_g7976 [Cudoniella acicularis]|uniref:Uncharacterized protein n=1 Tax=Cudoniella acicularis TaxID=354080 RepID=A0A8H4RIA6_9HELO|nr:hypothetical protein G7Y89_g7976 [Cudoniella acicularis]
MCILDKKLRLVHTTSPEKLRKVKPWKALNAIEKALLRNMLTWQSKDGCRIQEAYDLIVESNLEKALEGFKRVVHWQDSGEKEISPIWEGYTQGAKIIGGDPVIQEQRDKLHETTLEVVGLLAVPASIPLTKHTFYYQVTRTIILMIALYRACNVLLSREISMSRERGLLSLRSVKQVLADKPPSSLRSLGPHVTSHMISGRDSAVEDQEWRKLAILQNPDFLLPGEKFVADRARHMGEETLDNIAAQIPEEGKVAISLDGCSSTTRHSYIAIIVTVINEAYELLEFLIGFENMRGVKADNASENGTIMAEINEYLDEAFRDGRFLNGQIQHIPCLAHILQLGSRAMLGTVRLRPKNEVLENNWHEDQMLTELEAEKQQRGIIYTLDKTRWDSACYMMIRFVKLRKAIEKLTSTDTKAKMFALSRIEWKQLEYLIDLIKPFAFFITQVSNSKNVSVHNTLTIYDEVFKRLHESRRKLTTKINKPEYEWAQPLIGAIDEAEQKLDKYYKQIYRDLGSI